MEDIISFLRNCIASFVFNNDDFYLDKLYLALLDKDNKALNIEFSNPDNIVNGDKNSHLNDQLIEQLLSGDDNIFYRILIILMITSDYYEYTKFLNKENDYIEFLDNPNISFEVIIEKFRTDTKFAFEILTVSSYYSKDMESLLTTACIDNILENYDLKKQILKINPFVFIEYLKKKDLMTDFKNEYIISFYFRHIYERAINDFVLENKEDIKLDDDIDEDNFDDDIEALELEEEEAEELLEAIDNYENAIDFIDKDAENAAVLSDEDFYVIDEEFIQKMLIQLMKLFKNDQSQVCDALQFMVYNILYVTVKDFNNLGEINELYQLMVDLEPCDIVYRFLYDVNFREIILECYRGSILIRQSDIDASFAFPSQKRVMDMLKKFNPFGEEFDDEIYHETNENLINIMYEELYGICLGNNKKIIKILQYMICDVLTEMSKDYNEINNVITMLKNISNPYDLVKEFVYNCEFANFILNFYKKIMLNGIKKDPEVLFITQVLTLKKIRKYNPYAKESEDDEDD